MSKPLAIVIVNWNQYKLTQQTIQSLRQCSYQNFDCIIVENGSSDDSLQVLQQEASENTNIVLLTSPTNKGFSGGNNIGLTYVLQQGYEYVLLLNNDVEVEKEFLEPLLFKVQSASNMGAVQPLIYFHHNRELIWNAGSVYQPWWGNTKTIGYNTPDPLQKARSKPQKIDWITGCAFMMKTEVLKKVGLFSESFFAYYEDVDLSFKIKQAGYELVYEPQSVIYHIAGVSLKANQKNKEGYLDPQVHYLNARNRIWFLKKWVARYQLPTVIGYQFFYYTSISFYFLARVRISKWKAWNKGMLEGIFKPETQPKN